MTPIHIKLKQARELLGHNQKQAHELSSIPQKDISLMEHGNKKFVPNEYIQYLNKYDVDISTIFSDAKEALMKPKVAANIAGNSASKSKKDKNEVQNILKESDIEYKRLGVPTIITVNERGDENVLFVPVKARAGYLNGYGDPEFISQLPVYRLPGLSNGSYRMFEVQGLSMDGTLNDKDIVICQWCGLEGVRNDRVHVIVSRNDGIVVKRVLNRLETDNKLILKSDNYKHRSEYPNMILEPDEILEVWYVIAVISRHLKAPGEMFNRLSDLEGQMAIMTQRIELFEARNGS